MNVVLRTVKVLLWRRKVPGLKGPCFCRKHWPADPSTETATAASQALCSRGEHAWQMQYMKEIGINIALQQVFHQSACERLNPFRNQCQVWN